MSLFRLLDIGNKVVNLDLLEYLGYLKQTSRFITVDHVISEGIK